jgi:hypothetical protein
MENEEFWIWFGDHKQYLEDFISEKISDYKPYNELSEKLKEFNEFLIPELTMREDGKFVLIISCDGFKEGIPFVNDLREEIREVENWEIVKFRQPDPMEFIPINGLNLKRSHIFLTWQKKPSNKYYITFYVKGFSASNPNYETATLLHMDHTIGEYFSMTRIAGVECRKLGLFQSTKGLKNLDDLKLELDNPTASDKPVKGSRTKLFVFVGVPGKGCDATTEKLDADLKAGDLELSFTLKGNLLTARASDVSYYITVLGIGEKMKDYYDMARNFNISPNKTPVTSLSFPDRFNKLKEFYSIVEFEHAMKILMIMEKYINLEIYCFA